MKITLFIGVCLVALISLAVFVSAIQMDKYLPGYGTIGADYEQKSIRVFSGWNLVKGFPTPDWIFDGDISQSQIKAIYALDPTTQEYIRSYPENKELANVDIAMDYLIGNTAFWVYVEGSGELEYYTMEEWPLDKYQLFSGWNFVGIREDMMGKPGPNEPELKDLAGTCNIEKAYFFNPEQQEWGIFPLTEEFSSDVLNYGIALKVSSDCTLSTTSGEIIPPELP